MYWRGLSTNLYICGLNADGTRKLERDLFVGDEDSFSSLPLVPDDSGGVHISWGRDGIVLHRHMLGTGGFAEEEAQVVVQEWGGSRQSVKDRTGGCFILGESGRVQRVTYNGEIPWGEAGLDTMFFAAENSYPVSTPDSGLARTSASNNGVFFIRYRFNGSPYYDEYSILINNPEEERVSQSGNELLVQDSLEHVFYIIYISLDDDGYYISTRKVDGATAENMWDEPVRLGPTERESTDGIQSVLASDGSLIISNLDRSWGSKLLIHKVYPDGTIAGHEQGVDSDMQSKLPASFRVLSSFPNPFNGSVSIAVDITYPGRYQWNVYSITGQKIGNFAFSATRSGIHQQTWTPEESLAGGVYLIQWSKNNLPLTTTKIVYLP